MNEIDEYISQFEPEIQDRLLVIRGLFFEVLPETKESIRYNMPAYTVGNFYLYFAAYKNHIGFYPVTGLKELHDEILMYKAKNTKDSMHFPHSKPLPLTLIRKIILLKSTLR